MKSHRLAHGVALSDIVAQIKALYEEEGKALPKLGETLLSAYESGFKRPGPEYMHYLCAAYRVEPDDLGFTGPCICARDHVVPLTAAPHAAQVPRHPTAAMDPRFAPQPPPQPHPPRAAPRGTPPRSSGRSASGTSRSGTQAGPQPGLQPGTQPGLPGAGPAAEPGSQPGSRPAPRQGPPPPTGDALDYPQVLTGELVPRSPYDSQLLQEPSLVLRDLRLQYRADGQTSPDRVEEDNVFRRTLLQLLAGAGVGLDGQILDAADTARRRMDDALVTSSVSATMLDQWEETTAGYGREYMSIPPLRLLCDVLLDFGEVRRMCDRRQPIELQERLCRIATKLAGLAGIVMFDLGDHRLARSFFRTARTAADETGDRHLRAWVSVRETLIPLYYGDPREALHLARTAQGLAGRTPSVAGSMGPILESRALSQLARRGRSDAANSSLRALARGRAVFGRLSAHDQADAAFGYTERQMEFYEGNVYTNLGETRRADESLSRALAMYAGSERLDRTLIRLDRATCRLHDGEPEEALRACLQAIRDLPEAHRTDIVLHRARQLEDTAKTRYGELAIAGELRELLGRAVA